MLVEDPILMLVALDVVVTTVVVGVSVVVGSGSDIGNVTLVADLYL